MTSEEMGKLIQFPVNRIKNPGSPIQQAAQLKRATDGGGKLPVGPEAPPIGAAFNLQYSFVIDVAKLLQDLEGIANKSVDRRDLQSIGLSADAIRQKYYTVKP